MYLEALRLTCGSLLSGRGSLLIEKGLQEKLRILRKHSVLTRPRLKTHSLHIRFLQILDLLSSIKLPRILRAKIKSKI